MRGSLSDGRSIAHGHTEYLRALCLVHCYKIYIYVSDLKELNLIGKHFSYADDKVLVYSNLLKVER